MKKTGLIVIGVIVLLVVLGFNSFNGMKKAKIESDNAWANVQSQYQRRSDLIGNLVNTVKGAADFEKSTLEAVVQARANATKVQIDPSNMTPQQMQQFQQAQGQLNQSLGRLLVTVEKYPDLKANQNFLQLQSQLEGTENRINYARDEYNRVVKDYNYKIGKMPNAIFAGMMGFKERTMFQADAGADKAPTVQF